MAVLAAGYLGLCAFALHHSTIWQETFVLGVNVGGMNEEEATQAVSDALSEMADLPLPLSGWRGNAGTPPYRLRMPRSRCPIWTRRLTYPPCARRRRRPAAGSFFTAGWRYLAGHSMSYAGNPEDIQVDAAAGFHSGRGHCRLAFLAGAGHQLHRDGGFPGGHPGQGRPHRGRRRADRAAGTGRLESPS